MPSPADPDAGRLASAWGSAWSSRGVEAGKLSWRSNHRWPGPAAAALSSAGRDAPQLSSRMDLRRRLRSLTPGRAGARGLGVTAAGAPAYRAEQIFRWLHGQAVETRRRDDQRAAGAARGAGRRARRCGRSPTDVVQTARDGTRKLRFRTHDGRAIESVLIPDDDEERNKLTLCISSQVGCAIDCRFCATATLGFGRNLGAGEIVEQVYRATALAGRRPTNLVFMGMGEPLHNFDNVTRALALLQHPWGAAFSPRRITVSTVGLVPGIEKLGALGRRRPTWRSRSTRPTDEVRDRIMPINRKLAHRRAAGRGARASRSSHGRRVTFEYVLLARRQRQRRRRRPAAAAPARDPVQGQPHPLEPVPGPASSQRPPAERIRTFQERLRAAGWPSTSARRAATTSTPPAASSPPTSATRVAARTAPPRGCGAMAGAMAPTTS